MAPQVLTLPKWVLVLRGLQIFFAVIILGLSAYGVYWIAFNSWGFALFTSLATVIIVLYGSLTSRISALHAAYNFWAILALDAVGVIFWLSSMAALAATRATFTVPTTINGCVNDGSGGVCSKMRALEKRGYVATNGYLSMMSGAAGLSGLEMLLFIATITIVAINVKRECSSAAKYAPATNDKVESHPMTNQPYDQAQQYQQQQQQNPQQYTRAYPQQYPQTPQQYDPPMQPAPTTTIPAGANATPLALHAARMSPGGNMGSY